MRHVTRHGSDRVRKLVLVGAIRPLMFRTADNPNGTPIEVFDGLGAQVLADRSQLRKDPSSPFFGANWHESTVSQGTRDGFWLMGMAVGLTAAYDCIEQLSETDFNDELTRMGAVTRAAAIRVRCVIELTENAAPRERRGKRWARPTPTEPRRRSQPGLRPGRRPSTASEAGAAS